MTHVLAFVARRLLEAVPTLFGLTLVGFAIVHLVPGGPAETLLGPHATPATIALVNRLYGLNDPLPVQYLKWLGQLLHGNLGTSYFYGEPVFALILENLPRTLAVLGIAIAISHLLAVALGTWQGYRAGSSLDHLLTALSYFFYSMPIFWLGMILIRVFALDLGWFPAGGIASPTDTLTGFPEWAVHVVLPVATIVVATVAGWSRYMRSAMLETLAEDYIRTARAKGLPEAVVVLKHALRNSLLPLITLLGFSLPNLFSGALLVETIFNYPGLGLLFYNAALQRDYPVVLGGVLMIGVLTVLGNLLADILYALVDPRIEYV